MAEKHPDSQIKNGRTIDTEVCTLKNVLRHAELCELIPRFEFPNDGQVRKFKGESRHAKEKYPFCKFLNVS